VSDELSPRRLIAVFESPVSEMLFRFGVELGFRTVLVEPDPTRLAGAPRPHGDTFVSDLVAAAPDEYTDILLTDHHRPEIGALLKEALSGRSRWIGILGNPRAEGPHVAALRELGVPDDEISRVRRPVGLNIGSRTPPEIALAVLAGLIADRNHRPGGFAF
jgi:xanthine dehydrogenase accessory factor